MLNKLERRIIDISYRHKLSHVSSCLNTINLLSQIYASKQDEDIVVLANGHSGLALYVCLESLGYCDAEEMLKRHGIHPCRDDAHGVYVSSGSLGQCEPIAVGIAMAKPRSTVWLVTSDGALAEGSTWEAFNLATEQKLTNLRVHVVANGLGAYREIGVLDLQNKLLCFLKHSPLFMHLPVMPFLWLRGLDGHYLTISDAQYTEAMNDI